MPWDPDRYRSFERERAQPFVDLLGLIDVRPGLRVIDLGCGTGELTSRLAQALPGADVLGIDNSAEMLREAQRFDREGLRFEQRLIEEAGGEWDLLFSNAALQWVEGHNTLIPRLLTLLAPGGQIAVQVPSNHGHITHTLIIDIASEEPYRSALGGWTRRAPVLEIDAYANLLHEAGMEDIVVFEKVYAHMLENADALADWTSGTALVPYFERLDDALRKRFMEEYRARLRTHFPQSPVFYPFRRTLFAANDRSSR